MRADIDESFKQKGPKKKQSKAGNYEPRMESVSQFESQDDTGGHASSAGQQYDIQAYKEYYDNYGTSIRGESNNRSLKHTEDISFKQKAVEYGKMPKKDAGDFEYDDDEDDSRVVRQPTLIGEI